MNSPFRDFRDAASTNQVQLPNLPERRLWVEFRHIFSAPIHEAIWSNQKFSYNEWIQSRIPTSRLNPLIELLDPQILHTKEDLSLDEFYKELEDAYLKLRGNFPNNDLPHQVTNPAHSNNNIPFFTHTRAEAISNLHTALKRAPGCIHSCLLHGSLADGGVIDGYSDADVLCVLEAPQANTQNFLDAAKWIYNLHWNLLDINPSAHHGPMIAFIGEFTCAAEAHLPRAILNHGLWLKGSPQKIHYHDGMYEAIIAIGEFEEYFEKNYIVVADISNAYDALWWTSNTLMLPVLRHQMLESESIYKKTLIDLELNANTPFARFILPKLTKIRELLGAWLKHRTPAHIPPSPDRTPGKIPTELRNTLSLNGIETRALGFDDALAKNVRLYWHETKKMAAETIARLTNIQPETPPPWTWPRPTKDWPRLLNQAHYTEARITFLKRCEAIPSVIAVFEFGEVGCPGLSDLDFCVVLDDSSEGVPENLRASNFDPLTTYILDHDPIFISESSSKIIAGLMPIFSAIQIYGRPLSLPPSHCFSPEFQIAAITHKNIVKYPTDPDSLFRAAELDVRSLIALLHSLCHVKRCFLTINIECPIEIETAVNLDKSIRSKFQEGQLPTEQDIPVIIDACLACITPLQNSLLNYWINRSASYYDKAIHENLGIPWLLNEFASHNQREIHNGKPMLCPFLYDYLKSKASFVKFEQEHARPVPPYIENRYTTQELYQRIDNLAGDRHKRLGLIQELQIENASIKARVPPAVPCIKNSLNDNCTQNSNKRLNIGFIGHSYHQHTGSSAFFLKIIETMGQVTYYWDDQWRSKTRTNHQAIAAAAHDLIIIWQVEYLVPEFATLDLPNVIFAPMYDACRLMPDEYWHSLKNVKILAFCHAIHERAQSCGLTSSFFQYFPDPSLLPKRSPAPGLRGYFWQRKKDLAWPLIRNLIRKNYFSKFILHDATDPENGPLIRPSTKEIETHQIEFSQWSPEASHQHAVIAQANVYFAPRFYEGIGMSFLEAMAMGLVVVAPNRPTMNEYIIDGHNGILYEPESPKSLSFKAIEQISINSRQTIIRGFNRWTSNIPRLKEFLLTSRNVAPNTNTSVSPKTNHHAPHQPLVTIATVVFNGEVTIEATIQSVLSQKFESFEYIIIDGASKDNTASIIHKYRSSISKFISEADHGPYDAMNKAARHASGKWILFMNAGDQFSSPDALREALAEAPPNADFIIAHHYYRSLNNVNHWHRVNDFNQTWECLVRGNINFLWSHGIPCHQSTLTKVDLIARTGYDTSYSIAADHEFMFRCKSQGAHFYLSDSTLSIYTSGGMSWKRQLTCEQEWLRLCEQYTQAPAKIRAYFKKRIQSQHSSGNPESLKYHAPLFTAIYQEFKNGTSLMKCLRNISYILTSRTVWALTPPLPMRSRTAIVSLFAGKPIIINQSHKETPPTTPWRKTPSH